MSVFQLSAGVGVQSGATLPSATGGIMSSSGVAPTVTSSPGTAVDGSIAGEPLAVWLGMILVLIILKVVSQSPEIKILGENVNPAFIRIGGYNWLAIGISAATFIIIFKVIFNQIQVPGITSFANAL